MSWKLFHAVYTVVTQVWATPRAVALSCSLLELYQPITRNHCRGAHALGKSHCCEDCRRDVGIPPGYFSNLRSWRALSTSSCLVTLTPGVQPQRRGTREDRYTDSRCLFVSRSRSSHSPAVSFQNTASNACCLCCKAC